MQENGTHRELSQGIPSLESVRLLWEGTRKATDGGIDTEDLVSLCEIIVRLADHRLLFADAEEIADQFRQYRKLASELLQWATAPAPEPNWSSIAEGLVSVGAAPLDFQGQSRE